MMEGASAIDLVLMIVHVWSTKKDVLPLWRIDEAGNRHLIIDEH